MSKKKVRKRKNHNKKITWRDFKPSKPMWLLMSVVFAIMIVIRATFAWETYTSSKENQFGNTNFEVVLREKFSPNFEWTPGVETLKKVYVVNEGHYEAFVRLSAEEFLLSFDLDIDGTDSFEGTGNPKVVTDGKNKPLIEQKDVSTWKKNALYPVEKDKKKVFYTALKTVPADIKKDNPGLNYPKDEVKRKATDLEFFKLNFGDVKNYTPTLTKDYWLYGNDGYFYYSESLKPGEKSAYFLKSVSLYPNAPNRIKSSLHKVNISMDAGYTTRDTLGKWNHETENDLIYQMLKSKVTAQPK